MSTNRKLLSLSPPLPSPSASSYRHHNNHNRHHHYNHHHHHHHHHIFLPPPPWPIEWKIVLRARKKGSEDQRRGLSRQIEQGGNIQALNVKRHSTATLIQSIINHQPSLCNTFQVLSGTVSLVDGAGSKVLVANNQKRFV